MTKEFVEKRIKEQEEYIIQICEDTVLTHARKLEIITSAVGQLNYFRQQQIPNLNKGSLVVVMSGGRSHGKNQMLMNLALAMGNMPQVNFVDNLPKELNIEDIHTRITDMNLLRPISISEEHHDFKEKHLKDNFTNNPIGAIGHKNKRKRDYGRGNCRK